MSVDESLDAHESGLALVASRIFFHLLTPTSVSLPVTGNPFRETGPPANMAKLILLRHKVSLAYLARFERFPDMPPLADPNK
ncbi:hypothetical protein GALMADRAFT_235618 [Galerina marginata CBS 339.88]|uniref:Uncharacterized protein n=1 Tax=Galerina marginata (strain CBS 339.88) TaxID=685588 RepID=A0A067TWU2_GALM3|nr:hypothetical protein GALMADRAFT_235618 [Galerina marginata CBS 339.88]